MKSAGHITKDVFTDITSKATCYYSISNFKVLKSDNLILIYIPNVRLQSFANSNPILKVDGISFPAYSINTFLRGNNGNLYQVYLRFTGDTVYLDGIFNMTINDWVTASIDAWLNLNLIINI